MKSPPIGRVQIGRGHQSSHSAITAAESLFASSDELILNPNVERPHVVILGAGASVAACPQGDKHGRTLPTMANIVDVLRLRPLLSKNGLRYADENFENLYSSLSAEATRFALLREIETKVHIYFSSLKLPDSPTVYDHLLLSLRRKDAVFTFNWDPFLFDAYARNQHFELPAIFFLHGNVRIAHCPTHVDQSGATDSICPRCGRDLVVSRLLYPITMKNYSADLFIQSQWNAAESFLGGAFALTVFGYGAPASDTEAVRIMKTAWHSEQERLINRVEIIDLKARDALYDTWSPFITHHHHDCRSSFYDSYIANYPRRSCEGLFIPSVEGRAAYHFPIPRNSDFSGLHEWIAKIAAHEVPK